MRQPGAATSSEGWSSRYTMALIAAVWIAAVTLGAVEVFYYANRLAKEAAAERLGATLRTTQLALKGWFDTRLVEVSRSLEDPRFAEALETVAESQELSRAELLSAEALLIARWKQVDSLQIAQNWALVDGDGTGLVGSNERLRAIAGALWRQVSAERAAFLQRRPFFATTPSASGEEDEWGAWFREREATVYWVSPVARVAPGPLLVMVLEMPLPSSWLEQLVKAQGLSGLELFDGEARSLCSSREGSQSERIGGCSATPQARARRLANISHPRTSVDVDPETDVRGQPQLNALLWDDTLELGFGLSLPEAQVLSVIATRTKWAVLAWLAFVLASVLPVVVGWLGHRRLRRVEDNLNARLERTLEQRTYELTQDNERLRQRLASVQLLEQNGKNTQRPLEEKTERYGNLSQMDALTSLANRRSFDESIEQSWRYAAKEGACVSLLLIDLDYFRLFNDAYGHSAGDDCLREIAEILSGSVRRPEDLAARLGGDQFALLLYKADAEVARAVAQHIHGAVEELALDHEMTMVQNADTVTVSIGCHSQVPDEQTGVSGLLYRADEALLTAKHDGRDCVRSYDDARVVSTSASSLRPISPSLWAADGRSRRGRP